MKKIGIVLLITFVFTALNAESPERYLNKVYIVNQSEIDFYAQAFASKNRRKSGWKPIKIKVGETRLLVSRSSGGHFLQRKQILNHILLSYKGLGFKPPRITDERHIIKMMDKNFKVTTQKNKNIRTYIYTVKRLKFY